MFLLPLWDIVTIAFHRGSEDLLFATLFVAQFLMDGSSSMIFLPLYIRGLFSLVAWHAY